MEFIFLVALLNNLIKIATLKQPSVQSRIIGGKSASIRKHPYQLSLLFHGRHLCGAALINKSTALTGAHCISQPIKPHYSIRAGSSLHNSKGVLVKVKRVILNPYFNKRNLDYDIAIVVLGRSLPFGPTIAPIGLSKAGRGPPEGTKAVVTGWGTTSPGDLLSSSPRLQVAEVRVVSQSKCRKNYHAFVPITDRMLCAGDSSGRQDACQDLCSRPSTVQKVNLTDFQGDSGGPLVANGKLIGIVSWGNDCAQPNYPGVYTKVSRVREFIRQHTGL